MKPKLLKSLVLSTMIAVGAGAAYTFTPITSTEVQAEEITVYKSPTCGCCTDWIKHMEDNGFKVVAKDVQNMHQIKQQAGLTPGLGSCHTAFVDGYVIEGHVPASDVKRLLEERPDARGLAVPGMPIGSPGMEVAGRPNDPYDVVLFRENGQQERFSHHQ